MTSLGKTSEAGGKLRGQSRERRRDSRGEECLQHEERALKQWEAPPSLLHTDLEQDLPTAAILYKRQSVSKREKVLDLGLAALHHGEGTRRAKYPSPRPVPSLLIVGKAPTFPLP